MKIVKIGLLALFPVLMTGCVIDAGPYPAGYSGGDTYYVDSYGQRHYRHHRRYSRGGYYQGGSGGFTGGGVAPSSGGFSGGGVSSGGGFSGGSANPSRPSGFGRSAGASPIPSSAPSAPHGGFSGGSASPVSAPAPERKIILNKPNPSLPHAPSSTHVLTPEKKENGGFSGGGTPAH